MNLYKVKYKVTAHGLIFEGDITLDTPEDNCLPRIQSIIRDMYNCERDDVNITSLSKINLDYKIEDIY